MLPIVTYRTQAVNLRSPVLVLRLLSLSHPPPATAGRGWVSLRSRDIGMGAIGDTHYGPSVSPLEIGQAGGGRPSGRSVGVAPPDRGHEPARSGSSPSAALHRPRRQPAPAGQVGHRGPGRPAPLVAQQQHPHQRGRRVRAAGPSGRGTGSAATSFFTTASGFLFGSAAAAGSVRGRAGGSPRTRAAAGRRPTAGRRSSGIPLRFAVPEQLARLVEQFGPVSGRRACVSRVEPHHRQVGPEGDVGQLGVPGLDVLEGRPPVLRRGSMKASSAAYSMSPDSLKLASVSPS